jgi:hypothetical protein
MAAASRAARMRGSVKSSPTRAARRSAARCARAAGEVPAVGDQVGGNIARESGGAETRKGERVASDAVDEPFGEERKLGRKRSAEFAGARDGGGNEDETGEGVGGGSEASGVEVIFGFDRVSVEAVGPVDERGGDAPSGGLVAAGSAGRAESGYGREGGGIGGRRAPRAGAGADGGGRREGRRARSGLRQRRPGEAEGAFRRETTGIQDRRRSPRFRAYGGSPEGAMSEGRFRRGR